MKLKILRDFRVGSISDPKRMVAGNVVDASDMIEATPERIEKWVKMGWVKVVE